MEPSAACVWQRLTSTGLNKKIVKDCILNLTIHVIHILICNLCACFFFIHIVIEQNIAKKNLEAFLKITRRSINSTSTSYRSDLDRVQDALEVGDILTIDTLKARGRADLNLTVDHTKGV